jgi:hypothetical protein
MFTIKDLIKELEKMPQDAIVARDRSLCWNENPVPYKSVKSHNFKHEVKLENVKGINYLLIGNDPIDY